VIKYFCRENTMKTVLCFLVPVYEIENAIEICNNIFKFTVNSVIVLHNNGTFSNEELENEINSRIGGDRVVVNYERLKMLSPHYVLPDRRDFDHTIEPIEHANKDPINLISLYEILRSNLRFALLFDGWTHAVHMTSNERFVRRGVEEYIKNYDSGYSGIPLYGFDGINTEITKKRKPHGDPFWLFKVYGITHYGQVDGTFFSRRFAQFLNKKDLPKYAYRLICPSELFLPTQMHEFSDNIGKSITYMDFIKEELSIEDVKRVQSGEIPEKFCVKRVNMSDTNLRMFINNTHRHVPCFL